MRYKGVNQSMHPINQQAVVNRLNRRIFLGNGLAGSLGTMAASRLRAEEAGAPWLKTKGQKGDLPVSIRCPIADGSV